MGWSFAVISYEKTIRLGPPERRVLFVALRIKTPDEASVTRDDATKASAKEQAKVVAMSVALSMPSTRNKAITAAVVAAATPFAVVTTMPNIKTCAVQYDIVLGCTKEAMCMLIFLILCALV